MQESTSLMGSKTSQQNFCIHHYLKIAVAASLLLAMVSTLLPTASADETTDSVSHLIESNVTRSDLQTRDCARMLGLTVGRYVCGYLTVPENYKDKTSNLIKIPFLVIAPDKHLLDATLDPLLITGGGGPGNALLGNQHYRIVDDEFWTYEEMSVAEGRVLMILENRGAGLSEPSLDCNYQPEIFQNNFWSQLINMDFDCGKQYDEAGVDIAQYNVRNAALDIEMFRTLQKKSRTNATQLNLYGISYGTHVAMYYERLFPAKTRTMILDSVAVTDKDSLDEELVYAQRSLDLVFSKCRSNKKCNDRFGPTLEAEFYNFLLEVAAKEISLNISWPGRSQKISVPVTASLIINSVHDALYSGESIAAIPLMVSTMINGSYDRLTAGITDHIQGYSAQYAFSDTAFLTYLCFDEDYSGQSETDLSNLPLFNYWDLDKGKEYMQRVCSHYGLDANQDVPFDRYISDTPTLLLSGELDPVTPPATADKAAEYFSYHWNIVRDNVAHDVITHSRCARFLASWFIYHPQEDLNSRIKECEPEATIIPFLID